MRRVLPIVAAAVTAGAVVAGGWYAGRTTSPAAADVVTQPAAAADSPADDAAMRACVIGFGLALDAGLSWDSNTALEDAYELGALVDRLSDKKLRAAAKELARQIPRLVGQPEYESDESGELSSTAVTDDPTDPLADDPTEQITELLWDLRNACDNRFL